jgi:hypothetical protein
MESVSLLQDEEDLIVVPRPRKCCARCCFACKRVCLDECNCADFRCSLACNLLWIIGGILGAGFICGILFVIGALWSMLIMETWDKDSHGNYPGCTKNELFMCELVGAMFCCALAIVALIAYVLLQAGKHLARYCRRIDEDYQRIIREAEPAQIQSAGNVGVSDTAAKDKEEA